MDTWLLIIALASPVQIDGFTSYEACRSTGATQQTCSRPADSVLNLCWTPKWFCIRKPAGTIVKN